MSELKSKFNLGDEVVVKINTSHGKEIIAGPARIVAKGLNNYYGCWYYLLDIPGAHSKQFLKDACQHSTIEINPEAKDINKHFYSASDMTLELYSPADIDSNEERGGLSYL